MEGEGVRKCRGGREEVGKEKGRGKGRRKMEKEGKEGKGMGIGGRKRKGKTKMKERMEKGRQTRRKIKENIETEAGG